MNPPNSSSSPEEGDADLHTHSVYSDGSDSPREIVRKAAQLGLSAVGLTDHDSIDGLAEFLEAGEEYSVDVVPGLEISTIHRGEKYHVLGYGVDRSHDELRSRLDYYQRCRTRRVRRMVEVLREEEGIQLPFEEVQECAGRNLMGKPHVARALRNQGVVDTTSEAFDRFLGRGKLLDRVPKERMKLRQAIRLIQQAGGTSVLAHPVFYEPDLELEALLEWQIDGIEVFYPEHTEEQRQRYLEFAREYQLAITGGSDYHGSVKPETRLGEVRLPDRFYSQLVNGLKF